MPAMQLPSKYVKILAVLSLALLLLTIFVFFYDSELSRPWKKYQREFKQLDLQLTSAEIQKAQQMADGPKKEKKLELLNKRFARIRASRPGIKQFWLTDLGRTDRCTTCHQGMEYARFQGVDPPYGAHPGEQVSANRHPSETFGCTVCHGGQGVALTVDDAHGEAHNWVEPFLPGTRAEASCSLCHPMRTDVAMTAAMPGAPVYSRGRTLYLQRNCLGCHVLQGFDRPRRIGPPLTPIGTKTHPAWVQAWIKQPKSLLARTVMPDFQLQDDQIKGITAYLFSLSQPPASSGQARALMDSADLERRGLAKFEALGCNGCHAIDGKDTGFGPDLSREGEKTTPEWVYSWIKEPKKYWPQTAMPNLRVPEPDIQLLTAFLMTRTATKPIQPSTTRPGEDLVAQGKKLVASVGCTGCHAIGKLPLGFNAPEHNGIGKKRVDELVFADTDIPHTLPDWLKMKVRNPKAFTTPEIPTLMPRFGFTEDQAEALLTFLLSLRKEKIPAKYKAVLTKPADPLVQGAKIVEDHNCRGCHRIGGRGGTVGPDLTFEGARINPAWLVDFLLQPHKIRPPGILPTRMPTFGFNQQEATALAAYFAAQSKVSYPYVKPVVKKMAKADVDDAWKMFFQTFSCHACHSWNGQGGVIGPDQSDLGNRLRRQWVSQWLKNPQKFIADVRMPNFELYPDEVEKLTGLLMDFKTITPGVWEQMRKRWEDEQLAKQAQEMEGN